MSYSDNPSPLGRRLLAARLKAGHESARSAALACRMAPVVYRQIEGGKDARYSSLCRILRGLNIEPAALFPERTDA